MRCLLAASLVGALGACGATRGDDLAACKAAEARLVTDRDEGPRVIAACLRAHRTTGSSDALIIATRTQVTHGDRDAVIATAAAATGEAAPRLWNLAGEAELLRGRHGEARRWYERSLEAQRARDPRRAANTAARIANVESARGALDEAIRFQHAGRELAAAGGDSTLSALMAIDLAQLALDVGDVRAAGATLAGITDEVRPSSSFYREYLATAGELDALAGRPATARASFELCVRGATAFDLAATQWRCHLGLATLAFADGRNADARAALDLAAGYHDATDREFGPDPDRAAEVAWLRARLDLRESPGDRARASEVIASLQELAREPLGVGMRSRVSFTIGRTLVDHGRGGEAEPWFTAAAGAVELLRDGAHYREVRRSLPRELRAPYEALFALRVAAGDPDGALDALERALTRDFVDQLAASVVGDVPAADGNDDPITTAERRARALRTLDSRPAIRLDPATVTWPIVGFFAAEGTLWRTRIAERQVSVVAVASLARLAPLVKAVRANPASAPEARELRGFLLPAEVLPAPDQPLVIVPDPFLEGVRFAALIADGRYIVERNPVVLAPTFTMAAGFGIDPEASMGPAVVLGVVDPTLPAVAEEVRQVGGFLGAAPRLGRAADRAALIEARRARVLHVASHGSARNDETFLVLGDGDVGTADVLEQHVAPELVVVASCLSAASRPDAMWTSIAAAFLANGSRMVIGATASIPDGEARAIVVEMHRHAQHVAPPLALARALRAAIARGTSPRIWSAFAVLGSPGG